MSERRRDEVYVADILEAIAVITSHVQQTDRRTLDAQPLLRDGVLFNLLKIGEAAKALSPEFRLHYPDVPWPVIGKMRDRVIHPYWTIDWDIVWNVVVVELPKLEKTLKRILEERAG